MGVLMHDAPGEITRRCAPRPFGAALRAFSAEAALCSRLRRSSCASLRTAAAARQRSTRPRGRVVELVLLVCREFELERRAGGGDEGFLGKESGGAPGEIASGPAAPRPPLRSGPPPRLARQRPTRRRRRVVELVLLVCREFELERRAGGGDEGFLGKESGGAPGEIRTPGLLVRSRRDDFIGSLFSTT